MRVLILRIMKLKDYKFEDKNDLKMFKYLKRTLKDIGFVWSNDAPMRRETHIRFRIKNDEIIKMCYRSRHNHSGEDRPTNCGYWLGDIGYNPSATDVIRLLWQLRVIDTYGICPSCQSNARTCLTSIMNRNISESERTLLYSNIDLIKKYINNIFPELCEGNDEMIDNVIRIMTIDKSGLPM